MRRHRRTLAWCRLLRRKFGRYFMSKSLKRLLMVFAACHLTLVAIGGSGFPVENISHAIGFYSALSGANSSYGFFAPGVGGELRARFEIDGHNVTTLESGMNRESYLKVHNIITQFWERVKDEKLRRSMSASWAGKMFGRFPHAKAVVVRVEEYDPPAIDEWARGTRSQWEPFYTAKYERR